MMSDYHVLEMSTKQQWVNVVFHIPVTDKNNDAEVNYRAAVANAYTELKVPWIDGVAEHTQIIGGEIYEHAEKVEFNAGLTLLQKRGNIDAKFTALSVSIQNTINERFRLWGLNRDVV